MPVYHTERDAAFVELTTRLADLEDKLAQVTAERDRARDTAVALEQELAAVRLSAEERAAKFDAFAASTINVEDAPLYRAIADEFRTLVTRSGAA